MPELMKLLSTKSTMRYRPPKGTAGFERSAVRGCMRLPSPHAMINAKIRDTAITRSPDAAGNGSKTMPPNSSLIDRAASTQACWIDFASALPRFLYVLCCFFCFLYTSDAADVLLCVVFGG